MAITPSGNLALSLSYARTMLSASGTFQALTEAANASQALEHVHYGALPECSAGTEYSLDELQRARPYALVGSLSDSAAFETQRSSTNSFDRGGTIGVYLERDLDEYEQTHPEVAFLNWANAVGGIADDLLALGRAHPLADGHLYLMGVDILEYARNRPESYKDEGIIQFATFELRW